MPRIVNCVVGSPMGFKVNISDDLKLDDIVDALKVYHGDKYVIGKDTSFGVTPHYHIHFLCVKDVTANALKVFRTALGKKFTYLGKTDKLYTGQDLPSADSERWFAYAVKEEIVKIEGISHTPTLEILRKSSFETKRQNKVYSEKKANEEKEKKEFKDKILEYVKFHLPEYVIPDKYKNTINDMQKTRCLVIKFLMENGKTGSLKKGIIDSYVMFCNIHIYGWDEFKVLGNLYIL